MVIIGLALPLTMLAGYGHARAADAPARSSVAVWIDVRPWTCSSQLPALARELALACDAAGDVCHVAAREASAERRLVLQCEGDEGPKVAEEQDARGIRLWSVELGGALEDRLRTAAVWVVRAEGAEPIPLSAPARDAPVVASTPADAGAAREASAARARGRGITLGGSGRAAYTFSRSDGAPGYGAEIFVGGRLVPDANVGLVLGAVRYGLDTSGTADRSYSGAAATTAASAGMLLAWGAPFDASPFGLELALGPVVLIDRVTARHPTGSAFARCGFTAQIMKGRDVRPFASLGYMVFIGEQPFHVPSLDVGLAWSP